MKTTRWRMIVSSMNFTRFVWQLNRFHQELWSEQMGVNISIVDAKLPFALFNYSHSPTNGYVDDHVWHLVAFATTHWTTKLCLIQSNRMPLFLFLRIFVCFVCHSHSCIHAHTHTHAQIYCWALKALTSTFDQIDANPSNWRVPFLFSFLWLQVTVFFSFS